MMGIKSSRRAFLKASTLAVGTAALGGCKSWCKCARFRKPGEILTLAVAGVGGRGMGNWPEMMKLGNVRIAAMCDIDPEAIEGARKWYVDNKFAADFRVYTDYRKMLETEKGIDAVVVSTPDHDHAAIAIEAMKMGCHAYVEKPLVRTIWEARYFKRTAEENGVVTQMGNWGSAGDGFRRGVEVLRSGILGDVTEVHVWTNRPEISPGCNWGWKQPVWPPTGSDPIPAGFDWDSWIGTAPFRDFKKGVYHRIAWRAFHDFGTGAFGDMACHTTNLPFRGLELGTVLSGEAVEIAERVPGSYPLYSKVRISYAARGKKPPVDLYWYDGYRKPPKEIMPEVVATLGEVPTTGCLVIGSKGKLVSTNDYGEQSYIALTGESKMKVLEKHEACQSVPVTLPRVHGQHHKEFIDACRGEGKTFSDVDNSVPIVEGMLVGCLAQRVPGKINWDAAHCISDNKTANDLIKPFIRKGWEY